MKLTVLLAQLVLAALLFVGLSATVMAKRLGVHNTHVAIVQTDGYIYSVGSNEAGQLGYSGGGASSFPVRIMNVGGVIDISVGLDHTCWVVQGGKAQCIGSTEHGRLGTGEIGNGEIGYDETIEHHHVPADVVGLSTGVKRIYAKTYTTCALLTTGGARCWGSNTHGQLGLGKEDKRMFWFTPTSPVGFATGGALEIAVADNHVCILKTNYKPACVGRNDRGQLGDGTQEEKYLYSLVQGAALTNTFVSISSGNHHTCALSTGGAVFCWGEGGAGQLGKGPDETSSFVPDQMLGFDSGAAAISLSSSASFVIFANTTALAVGSNQNYVLGTTGFKSAHTPIVFSGLQSKLPFVGIAEIKSSEWVVCVLGVDEVVQCLGDNSLGMLGDGTLEPSDSLVRMQGLPTKSPTRVPTLKPTPPTTRTPTLLPTTAEPTMPTLAPTRAPTRAPTPKPTIQWTDGPTSVYSTRPTISSSALNTFGAGSSNILMALAVVLAVVIQ